jgi:uncharacterized membrane protein YkvA (DUF1232 family)
VTDNTPGDRNDGAIHHIDDAAATPARSTADLIKETVWALPATLNLLRKLMTDPRVPRRNKLLAVAALAYLVSPIDLVPDFVPVLGRFDDILLAAFAVDRLLRSVPAEVREGYWIGSPETLELVTGLLSWGAEMVPPKVRRILGS